MKKISKLLLVILSVLALVALTAFAISAADETVEGTFAVRDADGTLKGYSDWNAAVEAAKTAGNYTITLNDNWTISESADLYGPKGVQGYSGMYTADDGAGYKIVNDSHDAGVNLSEKTSIGTNFYTFQDGKNWTLDLNGKTVNVDMDGLLFYLYNTKLTITGGGTINNARQIVRAHKNSEFTIDATSPLVINPIGHKTETTTDADGKSTTTVKQQGRWVLFNAIDDTTVLNFKGKITFNPCDSGMLYIHASGAKEVNFDSAVITVAKPSRPVKVPTSESDSTLIDNPELVTKAINSFIKADDSGLTTVKFINGTYIDFKFGRFFDFTAGGVVSSVDLTGYLDRFPVVKKNATVSDKMAQSIDALIATRDTNYLNIIGNDSTIIVDPCDEYYKHDQDTPGRQQGRFITTGNGNVGANFTNCDIFAGAGAFYGDSESYPDKSESAVPNLSTTEDWTYYAGANQFIFKDCNFNRISGGKWTHLFIYGMNVVWEGGSINNQGGSVSVCNHFYSKPDPNKDYFYGVKFSNVSFANVPSLEPTPEDTSLPVATYWKCYFTVGEGETLYKDYKTVVDGQFVTYPAYITSVAPSIGSGYTYVGTTADYNQDTGVGKWDFGLINGTGEGVLVEKKFDNGNVVGQITFPKALSSDYFQFKPTMKAGAQFKYAILEFDIATNQETWTERTLSPQDRIYWPKYNTNGDYVGSARDDTLGYWLTPGGYKLSGLAGNGVWSRITVIEEWVIGTTVQNKTIPTYESKTSTTSNGTVTVPCIQASVKYHWYVNGEYKTTTNYDYGYTVDGEKWLPNASNLRADGGSGILFQDHIRMDWNSANTEEEISFDNINYISFPYYTDVDLSEYFAKGQNITGKPIGNSGLYFDRLQSANDYGKPVELPSYVGAVNGTNYETEAELVAALDAAEGYTELELKDDIASKLNITGKNLLIKHNGFAFKPVSESTKVLDYTASLDGYRTALASESEIFDILFDYTDASGKAYESQTVAAALGTYVPVPGIYDPASSDFAVTVAENTSAEKVTFDYLKAWKIGDSEDLIAKAGVPAATPIIESVKASYVHWDTNGDAEGGVVTKYYNPNVATKIPEADIQKYVGEGYEEVKHESGWYKTAVEFKQDDITDADLSVAGAVYMISTETVKHPWVEMYANATLRTHFRFNYYVPPVVDGITDVKVTNSKGASLPAYGTSKIPNDTRTWSVYSILIGATDTTDLEVNVSYHVDGEDAPFTFQVKYGMPSYVNSVMKNESHGKTAKRLIMNIVNYADQMMTATGVTQAADTTGKLKTYKQLITEYGTEYLDLHNKLDDKRFQTGGDIYEAEVANLNKDTDGAKYYDGVSILYTSYEPIFILKYSDYARTASPNGFQYPSNGQGSTNWGHSCIGTVTEIVVGKSSNYYYFHKAAPAGTQDFLPSSSGSQNDAQWKVDTGFTAKDSDGKYIYDYFVYGVTAYEKNTASWAYNGLPKLSDYAGVIQFRILMDGASVEGREDYPLVATYEYSLAAYVSSLIAANDKTAGSVPQSEINLAKSLYSLAHAAYDYKGND